MKKNRAILMVVILGLLVLGAIFFVFNQKSKNSSVLPTPTPEETLSEIPLEERPYVSLTPRADGKELTLEISLLKNVQTIEYELTYLSNDLSRGVIGSIDLTNEEEISRKITLGSCSRDVCKYDENVTSGNLLLRFRGPAGTSKYISDFRLQKGGNSLSSIDEKFTLEGKFSPASYYLVMSTVGLPMAAPGQVATGPYGIFTAGSTKITGIISFPDQTVIIYAWNGKIWQETENGLTTALTTFVAVTAP